MASKGMPFCFVRRLENVRTELMNYKGNIYVPDLRRWVHKVG